MSFRGRLGHLEEDCHINKRPRHSWTQPSREQQEESPRHSASSYVTTRPQAFIQTTALQTPPRSTFTPPQSFSPSSIVSSQPTSSPIPNSTWLRPLSTPIQRKLGDTSFRYVDLDKEASEIRLVRILPDTGSIIECELLHTSLEDPRSYIAVSYAWGDIEETRNIILNGHEFPVTESLWGALQSLRSRSFPVIIWADALCIDYLNVYERNNQVQLMTDIYRKAYSVSVWLGPEADNSHEAVDLMHELLEAEAKESEIEWLIRDIIRSRRRSQYFESLVSLFQREYWTRLWAVQEVTNAINVTVHCGSSMVPWRSFADISHLCQRYGSELDAAQLAAATEVLSPYPAPSSRWSTTLSTLGPNLIGDLGSMNNSTCGLLGALLHYRNRSCTDPRDKVYAVLGALSPYERSNIPVDYNLPVSHVFIDVVDYLLSTTRRLDVIRSSIHLSDHHSSVKLPSWTPDWSYDTKLRPIDNKYRHFSAAAKTDAKYSFSNRRKQLDISAIVLDTIESTGAELPSQAEVDNLITAFFSWRLSVIQRSCYDLAAHEAFCRTLFLDQAPQEWTSAEGMEFVYHTFGCLLQERLPALPLDPQLQFYASKASLVSAEQREKIFHSLIVDFMAARRFCISSTGLLCLGASVLRKDDVIVVPLGCSTPIILRRHAREYTYVGDIYVDGYMYGLVAEELNDGARYLESFTLN